MYKSVFILAVLALSCSASRAQVYNVVPIEFGDGYAIAAGSTMTIIDGELSSWDITVEGEYPYRFLSPEAPGNNARFENVIVTEDEIIITGPMDGILFNTNYDDGCQAVSCKAVLSWTPEADRVEFYHVASLDNPTNSLFEIDLSIPLAGPTLVAVASEQVPEPTTGLLSVISLIGLVDLARRRSQDNRA